MRARVHEGRSRKDFTGPDCAITPLPPFPPALVRGPVSGFRERPDGRYLPSPLCRRALVCVRASERHMVILYTPFWNRVFSTSSIECLRNCRFRRDHSVEPFQVAAAESSPKRHKFVHGISSALKLPRHTRKFVICFYLCLQHLGN